MIFEMTQTFIGAITLKTITLKLKVIISTHKQYSYTNLFISNYHIYLYCLFFVATGFKLPTRLLRIYTYIYKGRLSFDYSYLVTA